MEQAIEQLNRAAGLVVPEIILVATVCVNFLAGPFLVSERGEAPAGLRHRWGGLALLGLIVAAGVWLGQRPIAADLTALGPFRSDDLTWLIRGMSLAGGLVLLLMSWNLVDDQRAAEHHACLLLIIAGVNLIAAANDLTVLFLALEVVSIPTYVMLYLSKHDETGNEATIKYFLLSVFSSALLLYGFSFLYGVTGTTNMTAIATALRAGGTQTMPAVLLVAVVGILAGLAFRVTAVPFHFYAPDVFQGTSSSTAGLLAYVPKLAGFVALVRLLLPVIPAEAADVQWTLATAATPILWFLAAASMFVGNVVALQQTDIRRLMAWSSVAHAGYMLIGVTAAPYSGTAVAGTRAMLFYLAAYGAMTVGVFAILAALGRGTRRIEANEDLSGLSQSHPAAALLMTIFLLSLTGLPPTAGFLGKLNLFLAAWSAGTLATQSLAVLLAINAAIGAWYYLRLIGVMYLQPPREPVRQPLDISASLGVGLCGLGTIGLFVVPDWIWQAIQRVMI